MNRTIQAFLALSIVAVLGLAVAFTGDGSPTGRMTAEELDSFAQCLTENNATFYGAYWCPHCDTQKSMFGDAMEYVDYVECWPGGRPRSRPPAKICQEKNIRSTPTWIIQGERYTGVQTFKDLAKATGCSIPS
ncbi:MAG: hypothetical protein ABEJ62_00100 [Candidatus Nanohaloarchaea archaeon]